MKVQFLAVFSLNTFLFFLVLIYLSVFKVPDVKANERPRDEVSTTWKNGDLLIDMAPALCHLDDHYGLYRQCIEKKPYVIRGLDLGTSDCNVVSEMTLSPVQAKIVNYLMPEQKIQKQAWDEYGACSGLSSNRYFRQIIEQSKEISLPKELTDGREHIVRKDKLLRKMLNDNNGLTEYAIQLKCQDNKKFESVLVGIKLCHKNNQFSQCRDDSFGKLDVKECNQEFRIAGY